MARKYVNRAARYNYEIISKLEAGIQLKGYEVKGVREGRVNLRDAFVQIEDGEAWVYNLNIGLPSNARVDDYNPKRKRKLLLHKSEISRLKTDIEAKNTTAVVLELKWVRNRIKLLIGVGKGRKKYDKRRKIDKKETRKQIRRLKREPLY